MSEELNEDVVPNEDEALSTEETETDKGVVKLEKNKNTPAVRLRTAVPEIIKETVVDEALVEKTVQKINNIASTHFKNAITEVGQLLIDEFFYGNLDLVKQKNGGKLKSLRQVIKLLKQSKDNDYSRSWIYNAINLVLQNNAYESVQSYGHLSDGHKIELFPVKDESRKIELIEIAVSEKLSVSKFKDLIKQGKKPKPNDFVTFLKKMKFVQDTKVEDIFNEYNAINLTKEEYEELKKTIQIQTDKYEKLSLTIATTLKRYREIKEQIVKYSGMVEEK